MRSSSGVALQSNDDCAEKGDNPCALYNSEHLYPIHPVDLILLSIYTSTLGGPRYVLVGLDKGRR